MSLGLSACYLGSFTCHLKLFRQVPEREVSPDYSPLTHLPHHCDPPSQPRGREQGGTHPKGHRCRGRCPTVSSQQDWPAQIRDASSTKVHSLLACVRATLPHNTQEENLCSQGSWRNRDVKLSRAKQRCFQGWIVFFTQCQMSVTFCDVCWDIKNHLTVSLLGKILNPSSCKS